MSSASRSMPFLFVEICAQNDFLLPEAPMLVSNVESVVRNMDVLRREIGRAGAPALAGMDVHTPLDPEFKSNDLPPHAIAGTPGQQPHAGARDRSARIIPVSGQRRPWPNLKEIAELGGKLILEKRQFDLFSNPACREVLNGFGPRQLYLFGATMEHDIQATALSARTVGYEVTIVSDATGSRGRTDEVRGVLLGRGVRFETTEEAVTQITLSLKQRARDKRMRRQSE